jgi:hypothetical protein
MGYVDLDLKTKATLFIWCKSWSYNVCDRLEEFKEDDYCTK